MLSRPQLEVLPTALCVGAESVSLPTVRSIDAVFAAYADLVARLRREDPWFEVRRDDMRALADATGLEVSTVKRRVQNALSR